jgi:hypothetical protein
MKNFIKIMYIGLVMLLVASCNGPVVEKSYNIEMQKITGEWINGTYTLPEDMRLYIHTYQGSYSLSYRSKFGNGTVRNGIIDFKIKK